MLQVYLVIKITPEKKNEEEIISKAHQQSYSKSQKNLSFFKEVQKLERSSIQTS